MAANKPIADVTASLAGILVLDKPIGMSSMQAVAAVRRRAARARTGHAGTLDPLATGVLVLAIGRATKLIEQFMATSKRYRTVVDLSAFTTTDDAEGERQEVEVSTPPAMEQIRRVIASMVGEVTQTPPAFSAIKIGGRRAYKLARSGQKPTMPPRHVTLHDAQLINCDWPMADIELHTSKGFYVRSFARGLGVALHTGGHCASLRRTAVGPFGLDIARPLDDLPDALTQEDLLAPAEALAMVDAHRQA